MPDFIAQFQPWKKKPAEKEDNCLKTNPQCSSQSCPPPNKNKNIGLHRHRSRSHLKKPKLAW